MNETINWSMVNLEKHKIQTSFTEMDYPLSPQLTADALHLAQALASLPDEVLITLESTQDAWPEPPVLTIDPWFVRAMAKAYLARHSP